MRFSRYPFTHSVWVRSLSGLCILGSMFWSVSVGAADQSVPWECTGFTGKAQIRCARTFTELRQEKIAKLEQELAVQKQKNQQFQQQLAQQASTTAKFERTLTRKRSRWYNYPSRQFYPPIGLNFRYSRDRFFGGSSFFGKSRHYGPQFFGHGHRGRHRH